MAVRRPDFQVEVKNTDRAFGTILGAEITRNNKNGLPEDTVEIDCTGAGGQSFGAFIPKGLTLKLTGDCNDYFRKGSFRWQADPEDSGKCRLQSRR